MSDTKYTCQYCKQSFKKHETLLKHNCLKKQKAEMMQTLDGQMAFNYYKHWMNLQHRKILPLSNFIHSSVFTPFIKFVKFAKDNHIAYYKIFMKLMIEKNIQPNIWCRSEMLLLYLNHLDNIQTPFEQAVRTVDTLLHISTKYNLSVNKLISEMLTESDIVMLLRQRKISLWLLLNSEVFVNRMLALPDHVYDSFNESFKFDVWITKIKNDTIYRPAIKSLCDSLEI